MLARVCATGLLLARLLASVVVVVPAAVTMLPEVAALADCPSSAAPPAEPLAEEAASPATAVVPEDGGFSSEDVDQEVQVSQPSAKRVAALQHDQRLPLQKPVWYRPLSPGFSLHTAIRNRRGRYFE